MASIIKISKTNNNTSSPNTRWSITANEPNLFEVSDWIPKTTVDPKGGILPIPPSEIELGTRAKVIWQLKDKSQKIVFKTIASNVLDKFNFSINKKYSGSYTYFLEATLDSKKLKASAFVSGFCDPKIVGAKGSKKEGGNDMSDIKCGNFIYLTLDTEGLNGDNLTFEFYCEKDTKKPIVTQKEECINGDCVTKIPTIGASSFSTKSTEDYYVKVKNAAGVYVKNAGDEKIIKFKILKDVVPPVAAVPTNNTVLKVGEPDKSTLESTGIISLEKIAVTTTYDVCNDEVGKFNDYKNFWILENDGKHYHWLKKSLIGKTEKEDVNKPRAIPITLASTDKFVFTATFETILPAEVKVRVRDKDDKYKFDVVAHPKKAKKELHPITFTSTNKPYTNTVQYFQNFELIFEYSTDGTSWTPMGSALFCFYVTWKKPEFTKFENNSDQTKTMQIKLNNNNKKFNILETLLWLGCNQAKEKGKNEEEIVDASYVKFKTLKVIRSREGTKFLSTDYTSQGLGYWRGASTGANDPTFSPVRCLRFLIANGEARCGEWTSFFVHVLLAQGLDVEETTKAICTEWSAYNQGFEGYTYSEKNYGKLGLSMEFAVKNAIHNDVNRLRTISGDSAGQGNPKTQPTFSDHIWFYYKKKRYFDVSYGTSFSEKDSNLSNYCSKSLASVYLAPSSMKSIPASYPGGTGTIITTSIHDHVKSTI